MITAKLSNYRQSPQKVRLVVDLVRGKEVSKAISILGVLGKRASGPIKKLIESAVANAIHNDGVSKNEKLIIEDIGVNDGVILKRHRPRAMGRAFPIRKRTSHIVVKLVRGVNKNNIK